MKRNSENRETFASSLRSPVANGGDMNKLLTVFLKPLSFVNGDHFGRVHKMLFCLLCLAHATYI